MYLTKDSFLNSDWKNWKWQMKNSIKSIEDLSKWIEVSQEEFEAIEKTKEKYKWRVTPYYADLMDKYDANCPIRRQAIPHLDETIETATSNIDPVGDTKNRVTNRVVHKYPNRVILLVTSLCPVYCRHCTRKYHTTAIDNTYFGESEKLSFNEDFEYITNNKEVEDVLLTGGDPLMYSDTKIGYILEKLNEIDHVKLIRFGTRFPVLLPQRITDEFVNLIKGYKKIWVNTHFNHPNEVTPEALSAISKLIDNGIPVGNQTVLLKGVNDDAEILKKLNQTLVYNRIRPYYLYHCDDVTGIHHFRTSITKGLDIMDALVGYSTGFSVPQYVVTTELGKIPLLRENIVNHENNEYKLRGYKGNFITYTDSE